MRIVDIVGKLIHLVRDKVEDVREKIEAIQERVERKFDIPEDVIEARLDAAAAKIKPEPEWRLSVVDLLKTLGLDSSLEARAALAADLGHFGPFTGAAEENTRLHAEVLKAVAAYGIRLPRAD